MKNSKMKKSLSLILSLIMIMSTLSLIAVDTFAQETSAASLIVNLDGSSLKLNEVPTGMDVYCEKFSKYTLNRYFITEDDEKYVSLSKDDMVIKNLPENLSLSSIVTSSLYEDGQRLYLKASFFNSTAGYNDDIYPTYWVYTDDLENFYFSEVSPEKGKDWLRYITTVGGKDIYLQSERGFLYTDDINNEDSFKYLPMPNMKPALLSYENVDSEYMSKEIKCLPVKNGYLIYIVKWFPVEFITYYSLPEFYYTEDFVNYTAINTTELSSIKGDLKKGTDLDFDVVSSNSTNENSLMLIINQNNVKSEVVNGDVTSVKYLSGKTSFYQFDEKTMKFAKWHEIDDNAGFCYFAKDRAILNQQNNKFIILNGNTVNNYTHDGLIVKQGNNGISWCTNWDYDDKTDTVSNRYTFGFSDNSVWYTEDFKTIYNIIIPLSSGEQLSNIISTAAGNAMIEKTDKKNQRKVYVVKISDILNAVDEYKTTGKKIFPDVREGAWYYESVMYCTQKGYISGYQNGKFGPNDNLKRQDFVVILSKIAGADLDKYAKMTPKLKDVKKGAYYAAAVNWAVDNNIIAGYANGNFGVNDNITREQVATILYRYMGSPEIKDVDKTLAKFKDVNRISSFAKTAVAWAVQNNVISGMADGRVAPTEGAARAQIASIIMRMDQQGMFDKS